MEQHSHSCKECESLEEKLTVDAQGLIAKARTQSERLGIEIDPITFAQRADDDISALRAAILKEQGAVNLVADTEAADEGESVEVDPRLITFKADFDADPALKFKISWAEIQRRLCANEGHYLALAQAMEEGGQLFGVDEQGRPLISDRGDEPVMKGMNYRHTRDRVLYKHDRNDISGKLITSEDGQPQLTGYEMFPCAEDCEKSPELSQYEAHTGKHFVQFPGKKEWRSSWLESGEAPFWTPFVYSASDVQFSKVYNYGDPKREGDDRGVRRLLRVEKAA